MTNKVFLLAGATALIFSSPAFAQLEDEIIVTATKRAESIQDVPISISAYGAEFIEDSGVQDIRDIALYSPNFTISSSSQLSNNRIAIRGVGSVGNAGIEPSVGVFIDGIYYPRPGAVIGNLMDIQAVEVLRGPQGTLFGRNTPMGALNVRTKDPSMAGFEGNYQIGYGSQNAFNIGGAVNVPLGENTAMRLSGKLSDRDGFGDNLLTGENFGERKDLNLRGKLLFQPSDQLSVKLTADYGKIQSGGATIAFLNGTENPAFIGTLGALAGADSSQIVTDDTFDHDIYQDHRDDLDDKQWGLAGEVTYEFGSGHELKSITAIRNWDAKYFESAIRLPIQLFPRKTDYDNKTFSQEVQLLSPTGGAFDYLLGAFYYKEDYTISQDFDFGAQFCIPVVAGLAGLGAAGACAAGQQIDVSDGDFDQDLESLAVFGQGTFHASEQLSFTLGGRYTDDTKTADFTNVINNPFAIALSVRDNESRLGMNINENGFNTSQFTYFANVSYDVTPDAMIFATTSTGYKSGGFNTDGTFPALTRQQRIFGPEDTTNYELGIKTTLADGMWTLNATAFRLDIDGFQDRAFDGISFITRNVGSLRQQGLEVDTTFRPMDQLSFMGGLSYLDSEFTDYRNASPLPGGPVQDLTGERAHFAPKWQGSMVADWSDDFSMMGGTMYFLRGEVQHTGTQNIGANTNQNPQTVQEGYSLLNARVGLRADDDQWELNLWGKNLSDKGYCLTIFDQPFAPQLNGVRNLQNPQRCSVGAPLTYGVELKFRH
ncbi:TonB-dependent receptor [Fretibacter rubidus]|uniref:TonB-dependent receptor n=1 Tax=Fretibacter rubidus TaxID=570162 RepID=UPI00352A88B1